MEQKLLPQWTQTLSIDYFRNDYATFKKLHKRKITQSMESWCTCSYNEYKMLLKIHGKIIKDFPYVTYILSFDMATGKLTFRKEWELIPPTETK